MVAGAVGEMFELLIPANVHGQQAHRRMQGGTFHSGLAYDQISDILYDHGNNSTGGSRFQCDILFTIFLIWVFLGCLCAYSFEGFDAAKSFYFVISALSTCGNIAPNCDDGNEYTCELGFRGTFNLLYSPLSSSFQLYA